MTIIDYFELNSAFGRIFLNRKPKLRDGANLLNLGSGKVKMEGWVTSDFFPNVFPNFLKFSKYRNNADWMCDFRYPLNCNNEVWDGIYTSHTLEHLSYIQVGALLKELYRTMKKGACIRIVLPDLKKCVDFYNNKDTNLEFKKKYNTGVEAISDYTQNFGHKSSWDFELAYTYLKNCGYAEIKEVGFGTGSDKNLLIDFEGHKFESLYVEAIKPE